MFLCLWCLFHMLTPFYFSQFYCILISCFFCGVFIQSFRDIPGFVSFTNCCPSHSLGGYASEWCLRIGGATWYIQPCDCYWGDSEVGKLLGESSIEARFWRMNRSSAGTWCLSGNSRQEDGFSKLRRLFIRD